MVLFCEYVIPEGNRGSFTAWVTANPDLWRGVELAENTAQPGVIVEIRRAANEEEAANMEKERREGRSWKEMTQWVKGGGDGLRIWTFRPFGG
ncbi:hypothetical protein [Cohnella terricola]|uniref:Uncharacterized protein n=1 Tax=Cohnella terricola TaxID=1289167 RepID=A0A559JFR7_9BACL|nr:hypothetical protein [Cohnella terricola]TVX98724.1 hypothetical protein FPZ45_15610 [Cohnella terricola]